MKILKLSTQIAAATSLVGFVASQAFAGTCLTQLRNFPPAGGQDIIFMSCARLTGPATAGGAAAGFIGGQRTVNTNKTAGGAGLSVVSQGLTAAGVVVCTSTDVTIGGGANNVNCPATAVRFRGTITHVE